MKRDCHFTLKREITQVNGLTGTRSMSPSSTQSYSVFFAEGDDQENSKQQVTVFLIFVLNFL